MSAESGPQRFLRITAAGLIVNLLDSDERQQ